MISRFEQLLKEMEPFVHLTLHLDRQSACSLKLDELTIQMQLDREQENVLLFAQIGEIAHGKHRENVLMKALKANYKPDPIGGVFCYLAATNELAIFQKYPLTILNGERLTSFLFALNDLAVQFKQNSL